MGLELSLLFLAHDLIELRWKLTLPFLCSDSLCSLFVGFLLQLAKLLRELRIDPLDKQRQDHEPHAYKK